jgi:hypothetical protein
VGAVRVYLTSKLWLGAWLGAKRKDKKQEVRSKDNKLKLGYTYITLVSYISLALINPHLPVGFQPSL